ncbi:hypothetical protein L210DRAFT_116205 [Boletus edulis BED1]|uniref:Uncharacterized protein n=1 Tax=Boletus edulis BED1 TaxID=1328754 RepID=A0AAD4GC44_BOLED|nr:hypothetical protein L210DRAFT_116205 [Boletus edulis BED1]
MPNEKGREAACLLTNSISQSEGSSGYETSECCHRVSAFCYSKHEVILESSTKSEGSPSGPEHNDSPHSIHCVTSTTGLVSGSVPTACNGGRVTQTKVGATRQPASDWTTRDISRSCGSVEFAAWVTHGMAVRKTDSARICHRSQSDSICWTHGRSQTDALLEPSDPKVPISQQLSRRKSLQRACDTQLVQYQATKDCELCRSENRTQDLDVGRIQTGD